MTYYNGDIFTRGNRTFRVKHEPDDFGRTPWEDDGTGIVSDWTTRAKSPGERVLASDWKSHRYYDFAGTIAKAKAEGWGLAPADLGSLAARLGHEPTKNQVITEAVERDYERLRRWCEDQWCYVGVIVEPVDEDGTNLGERESLWGIESDDAEHLTEVAHDLADEINHRLDTTFAARAEQSRPDMYERGTDQAAGEGAGAI